MTYNNTHIQNIVYRAKSFVPKGGSGSYQWVYGYYGVGYSLQPEIVEFVDPKNPYQPPKRHRIARSTLGIALGFFHNKRTGDMEDMLFTGDVVHIEQFTPYAFLVDLVGGSLRYTDPSRVSYGVGVDIIPEQHVAKLGNLIDDPYLLNTEEKYVRPCDTSEWYELTIKPEAKCYSNRLELRNSVSCESCTLNTLRRRNKHYQPA